MLLVTTKIIWIDILGDCKNKRITRHSILNYYKGQYLASELTHLSPRSYFRSASKALRDGFLLLDEESPFADNEVIETEDSYLRRKKINLD